MYAQWKPVVSFDANGGNGTMPDQTAKARTTLALNTFTRPGYVFDGWRDAGGVWWPDGAGFNFPPSGPHTMYAQWKPVEVVTFDANGGTGSMPDQVEPSAAALTANAFTRTGYQFNGWATDPAGGRNYADGASYPFTASATLYARWACTPLSVTVSGKRVSHNRAEVTFSASSSESPWTSFTANSTVDGETATVSQSSNRGKITVNGLRKNQGYRFTVTATNAAGCSYTSETTNRVEQWRNESVDSVLR